MARARKIFLLWYKKHLVKDYRKRQHDKKQKDKTKDLMVINNDMELETSTPAVPEIELDADIMGDNDTIKVFDELVKML